MKRSFAILFVLSVGALVIGTLVRVDRSRPTIAPPSSESQPLAPGLTPELQSLAKPIAAVPTSSGFAAHSLLQPTSPESAAAPPPAKHVAADQVLATVNGKPIQLRHLVALEAGQAEASMSPEEYASRLDRAIEMELTLQAATAQNVALTPEQRQHLNNEAQRPEATLKEFRKQGISWSSSTSSQVEFQQRHVAALLLQQNLVAAAANVAPSPDPSTQARYEDALHGLINRLKATAEINLTD